MKSKAYFTDEVYQNELGSNDIDFNYQKHQPYFEFADNNNNFLIGLNDILNCLAIAQKVDMIPAINTEFWNIVEERYNVKLYEIEIDTEN